MSKPVIKPENLRRASAAYTELYNQNGLTVWATKSGRFELKCGSTTTVANNLADVADKVDNLSLAAFPGSGSEVVAAIKEAAAGKYCLEIRASKAGKEQVVHTLEGSLDKISDGLTGVASVNVKDLVAGRRYAMQQNMYGGEYMILIPMSDAMMNLDTSYDMPELYEKQVFSKGMVLHGICPKNNEVLTVLVSEAYPNGSFKDADGRVWSADDVAIYQFAIGTVAASEEDFKEPDDALYVSEDLPSYNPVGVVKEQAPMIGNLANYDTILTASADVISDFMKTCRKVAYLDKSSLNKVTVSAVNGEGQATDGSIEWNVRLGSPSYKRVSTVTIPLVMVNGSIDLGKEFITSTGAKLPLTPEAVHAHLGTLADDDMFRHASKETNEQFPSTIKASKAMDAVFAGVVEASPVPMAEQTPIGADADKQNEVSATKKTAADDIIAPDFWIVGINETEFWSDDIKAQVDAIVTYYLYDANEVTHLASMTGSYYLYPITTDPWPKDSLSEEERDALFESVLSNSDLNPDYFDERTIDNIPAEHKIHIGDNGLSRPKQDDAASEAAYKEGIDALLDHYRGNPPYMPSLEKTSGVKAQKASKKTAAPGLRERQVNMLANSIVSNMAMYKEEIDKGELTAEDRALELVTGDSWEGYPKFSELNQKQVADLVQKGLTEKGFTSAQITEVLGVLNTAFSTQGAASVDATAAKKTFNKNSKAYQEGYQRGMDGLGYNPAPATLKTDEDYQDYANGLAAGSKTRNGSKKTAKIEVSLDKVYKPGLGAETTNLIKSYDLNDLQKDEPGRYEIIVDTVSSGASGTHQPSEVAAMFGITDQLIAEIKENGAYDESKSDVENIRNWEFSWEALEEAANSLADQISAAEHVDAPYDNGSFYFSHSENDGAYCLMYGWDGNDSTEGDEPDWQKDASKKTAIVDSDDTSRPAAYTLGVILWDADSETTEESVTASFGEHGTVINFENDEGLVQFGLQVDSREQALKAAKVADTSNGTIDAITQGTWGTIAENHGYPTAYDFVVDALGGDGTTGSKKCATIRPEEVQRFVDNPEAYGKSSAEVKGMTYGHIHDFLASRTMGGKKTAAADVTKDLIAVINSCVEGYTGEWDVSTDEGREGFLDMYALLETIEGAAGEDAAVKEEIESLKASCLEGFEGTWDASTAEGREGFKDMYDLAMQVGNELNLNVSTAKTITGSKSTTADKDTIDQFNLLGTPFTTNKGDTWYELAIDYGVEKGTESIESFATKEEALAAYERYLKENPKAPIFVDRWEMEPGEDGVPMPVETIIDSTTATASKKVAASAIIFDIGKMVDTFDPINGASGNMKDQGVFAANKVAWSVEDFWKEVESSTGCSKADFGVIDDGHISVAVLEDASGNQVHDAVLENVADHKEQKLADAKELFLVDYDVFIKLGDGTEPTEEVLTQMLGIGHI